MYVPPRDFPFEFPDGQPLQRSWLPGLQRLHRPRAIGAWVADLDRDDTRNRPRFEGPAEAMRRVPLHAGRAAHRGPDGAGKEEGKKNKHRHTRTHNSQKKKRDTIARERKTNAT